MKKLILTIILSVSLVIIPVPHLVETPEVQAADVVITITIPDQHVSRVSDAVINGLDCGELGTKACLKRELVRHVKRLVKSYESSQIVRDANTEIDALVDPEVN